MWMLFGLLVCVSVTVDAHLVNRAAINRVAKQVKDLQKEQENVFFLLDMLETNLTNQISNIQGKSAPASSGSKVIQIGENFEERLSDMEGKIDAIKTYLMGEKKGDIQLRKKSEEVIKAMEDKVVETDKVIKTLQSDIDITLADFEVKINKVNKTANVKINANGAVLYGGIGSACTTDGGECSTADSECRGGRCQCLPGLSYNVQAQSCVKTCEVYGETYQSVSRRIIRGFNDQKLEDVTLADCKKQCAEEETFLCRSFDYFPQWKDCYMSANVKSDAPDDAWEYNSEGHHFQRDCQ